VESAISEAAAQRPDVDAAATQVARRRTSARGDGVPGRPTAVPPAVIVGLVAVIWGVTFTVAESATRTLPPTDLVAWRFGIAFLLLAVFHRPAGRIPRPLRRRAVALGALLGIGFLLQTWALTAVGAMMSGFYTGLVVVFAPVIGWAVFRERMGRAGIVAIGTAAAGITVIAFRESGLGAGEILSLSSAAAWALHLVLLSRWADPRHALQLGRIQVAVVAAMALLMIVVDAMFSGRTPLPVAPSDSGTWMSVLFLAVLASAAAMVLLSWAQPRVSVVRGAVILTLEPVVAAVTDLVRGVQPGARTIWGAALLLLAMHMVNVSARDGSEPANARGRHAAPRSPRRRARRAA
jgi:drug/metabolite transporter (DMT)-like permease